MGDEIIGDSAIILLIAVCSSIAVGKKASKCNESPLLWGFICFIFCMVGYSLFIMTPIEIRLFKYSGILIGIGTMALLSNEEDTEKERKLLQRRKCCRRKKTKQRKKKIQILNLLTSYFPF